MADIVNFQEYNIVLTNIYDEEVATLKRKFYLECDGDISPLAFRQRGHTGTYIELEPTGETVSSVELVLEGLLPEMTVSRIDHFDDEEEVDIFLEKYSTSKYARVTDKHYQFSHEKLQYHIVYAVEYNETITPSNGLEYYTQLMRYILDRSNLF